MTFFTSEYGSKIDAKGRVVLPSRIKSQLPDDGASEWVLRKGFEPCLILYPMSAFKKVFFKISGLSEFNKEYRKLQRSFFAGTTVVELDANARFLIPKKMLAYGQLQKEAVFVGMGNKVEIWNDGLYQLHQVADPGEFSLLAQKYLNE